MERQKIIQIYLTSPSTLFEFGNDNEVNTLKNEDNFCLLFK